MFFEVNSFNNKEKQNDISHQSCTEWDKTFNKHFFEILSFSKEF